MGGANPLTLLEDVPDAAEGVDALAVGLARRPPSSTNVYSGLPLSVTWVKPSRLNVPSLPVTPAIFVTAPLTLSGGQAAKHAWDLHTRWRVVSGASW